MSKFVPPEQARELLGQAGYRMVGEVTPTDDKPGFTTTLTIWKTDPDIVVEGQRKPPVILVEISDASGSSKAAVYRMIDPEALTATGTNYMGGMGI